jgi:hypothetical protein
MATKTPARARAAAKTTPLKLSVIATLNMRFTSPSVAAERRSEAVRLKRLSLPITGSVRALARKCGRRLEKLEPPSQDLL